MNSTAEPKTLLLESRAPLAARCVRQLATHRPLLVVLLPALLMLWLPYRIGWTHLWWRGETMSGYQMLIPLGAFALGWVRLPRLHHPPLLPWEARLSDKPGGLTLFALGCLVWLLGHLWTYVEVSAVATVLLAAGIVFHLWGWRGLQAFQTPLLFLLLMVPLPGVLASPLSQSLQLNSTTAAANLLDLMGVPVQAMGNTLVLPHYHLEVSQACGGAGILLGVLVLTLWLLGMMRTSRLQQGVLLSLAVSLELGLNIGRITLMGLLALKWPKLTTALHDANSWVFTLLLFSLLYGIAHLLGMRTLCNAPMDTIEWE
jgi:exosortase